MVIYLLYRFRLLFKPERLSHSLCINGMSQLVTRQISQSAVKVFKINGLFHPFEAYLLVPERAVS